MTPLVVPIALSENRMARVQIPIDLAKDEAEKIARVVLAYGNRCRKSLTRFWCMKSRTG